MKAVASADLQLAGSAQTCMSEKAGVVRVSRAASNGAHQCSDVAQHLGLCVKQLQVFVFQHVALLAQLVGLRLRSQTLAASIPVKYFTAQRSSALNRCHRA